MRRIGPALVIGTCAAAKTKDAGALRNYVHGDATMQVLVVNTPEQPLPLGTVELIQQNGWSLTTADSFGGAMARARTGDVDAVVMSEPTARRDADREYSDFDSFLRFVCAQRIAGVLFTSSGGIANAGDPRSLVDVVGADQPLAELRGRLAMVDRYHGLVRRLERELHTMERLSKKLSEHFNDVDQEMQLAGRLQRDFLPKLNDRIQDIVFCSIYRPASFVSGDIFDVVRIDEDHTGIYLADAVGHGLAASLLTMFIKRAIVPKRLDCDQYEIVEPHDVLAALNDALAEEKLPGCQFVTGCYLLINHRTNTLRYARGGHPYPMLISNDGTIGELKSSGGLMGITRGEEFETCEAKLHPGDKVVLYTDGVELAFNADPDAAPDTKAFERLVESLQTETTRAMLGRIETVLDSNAETAPSVDDVTILAFERLS